MAKKTMQTDAVINLQKNLKTIRTVLNMEIYDLAKLVGLSRQAMWNMESGYTRMSIPQYIAIRHLFDYEISKMDDPKKQYRCKKVVALLVDNAEDPDYDWTEEIIRQLTKEEE